MGKNEKSNYRQHFREILGFDQEISDGVLDEIAPSITIGKATAFYISEGDRILERNYGGGNVTKICGKSVLVNVSGLDRTDASGELVFRLKDRICNKNGARLAYSTPVNVMVSSRSAIAVLTISAIIVPDRIEDVQITVKSFDLQGNSLGNILFNWNCVVPYSELIE